MGLKCVSVACGLHKNPGVATLHNASRTNCNPICPLTLESDQGHVVTTVEYSVSVFAVASPNTTVGEVGKSIIKVAIGPGQRRREVVVAQVFKSPGVCQAFMFPMSK